VSRNLPAWLLSAAGGSLAVEHLIAGVLLIAASLSWTWLNAGGVAACNPNYPRGRVSHQPAPGVYDPIQHARNLGEL